MNNFLEKQQNYVHKVNQYLEKFFNDFEYQENDVLKAMKYSVLSGGKRTRSVLTLAFCDMLKGNYNDALCAAASIEMIHTYSLIHDDLPCMDNADLRRGKPSCHIKYGEAIALLAGDALLNSAFENIINSDMNNNIKIEVIKVLSKSSGYKGMIFGQELDLKYQNKYVSDKMLNKIHEKKTGEMFSSSCMIGALVSNTSNEIVKLASEFGFCLGLNFQIVDDILDVIGDINILGKPTKSDYKNNKSTYVSILGLEKSKEISKNLSNKCEKILTNNFHEGSEFLIEVVNHLLSRKF